MEAAHRLRALSGETWSRHGRGHLSGCRLLSTYIPTAMTFWHAEDAAYTSPLSTRRLPKTPLRVIYTVPVDEQPNYWAPEVANASMYDRAAMAERRVIAVSCPEQNALTSSPEPFIRTATSPSDTYVRRTGIRRAQPADRFVTTIDPAAPAAISPASSYSIEFLWNVEDVATVAADVQAAGRLLVVSTSPVPLRLLPEITRGAGGHVSSPRSVANSTGSYSGPCVSLPRHGEMSDAGANPPGITRFCGAGVVTIYAPDGAASGARATSNIAADQGIDDCGVHASDAGTRGFRDSMPLPECPLSRIPTDRGQRWARL